MLHRPYWLKPALVTKGQAGSRLSHSVAFDRKFVGVRGEGSREFDKYYLFIYSSLCSLDFEHTLVYFSVGLVSKLRTWAVDLAGYFSAWLLHCPGRCASAWKLELG